MCGIFALLNYQENQIQFDDIKKHITERELQVDQSCFTSKWQDFIPRKMNTQPQQVQRPQQPPQQIRR